MINFKWLSTKPKQMEILCPPLSKIRLWRVREGLREGDKIANNPCGPALCSRKASALFQPASKSVKRNGLNVVFFFKIIE